MTKQPNHLIHETSPYLLQHAYNPVAWYPWGEVALTKAQQENKPILLSIGYSACHWCHVMAQESFIDPATAELMNSLFINIKVDREERPDLDKIYQLSHQLLTRRSGGWPLTIFLTPNKIPFFSGTYFPLESRYGMPAFQEVLRSIAEYFSTQKEKISTQSQQLQLALEKLSLASATTLQLTPEPLAKAKEEINESFDPQQGGFGHAPKFPQTPLIERLLRHYELSKELHEEDPVALNKVIYTLKKMASGGIYDQLGGGFFRYTVDAAWQIPHFEKMLYDNALLLWLYAIAINFNDDPIFSKVTTETAEWVIREMQSSNGGYFSTLDADSEHHEGKYYYWDKTELEHLLTSAEYEACTKHFGLNQPANFESHWHLYIDQDRTEQTSALIESAREKLFRARTQRIRPARDEKILTAWNGLMIKGMLTAGLKLQREDFIISANQALDFIQQHLWRQERLYASYKDGKIGSLAYLDDYAFLIDAILTALTVRWRSEDLKFAIALANAMLEHFEDKNHGGFYFTANDHEQLIQRPKTLMDEAIPAGNGVAALVLNRLGHLLGETRYLHAAERTLRIAWINMLNFPSAHNSLLHALEEFLYPPQMIILRGEIDAMKAWQAVYQQVPTLRKMGYAIPSKAKDLPEILDRYPAQPDHVVAYLCQGNQCQPPIDSIQQFVDKLSAEDK